MPDALETLIPRLPLPLVQLAHRARRALSPSARHDFFYYLLEATLRLAAAAQIGCYLSSGRGSDKIDRDLENLVRPSAGHWIHYLSVIAKHMAGRADAGLLPLRGVAVELKRRRDDLQACSRLMEAMTEIGRAAPRAPGEWNLAEFFGTLVEYRNAVKGHGSRHGDPFYERMAQLFELACVELLENCLDTLLGGLKLMVPRRRQTSQPGEAPLIWYDLTGRLEANPCEPPVSAAAARAIPGWPVLGGPGALVSLFPLVAYGEDENGINRVAFLNSADPEGDGVRRVVYLDYTTGHHLHNIDAADAVADLLTGVRGARVDSTEGERLHQEHEPAAGERAQADAEPGRRIGEYDPLDRLGGGAMATVYRARQRSTGRIVALKVLHSPLAAEPENLERFHREVEALARCDHENVVTVYGAGTQGDLHYFAMELVDGATLAGVFRTLSRWGDAGTPLSKGHLSAAAALPEPAAGDQDPPPPVDAAGDYYRGLAELMAGAAAGLAHLHAHGILHRDVKPANLMVTRRGFRAVVTDLGLARGAASMALPLTEANRAIGTWRYMAPEQIPPLALAPDKRVDVYGLGATLYELACRKPLYDADDAVVLAAKRERDPVPPREANREVPKDLAAIIEKALARDPDQRYPSAAWMEEDLRAFARGEPLIHARPAGVLARAARRLRRHRGKLAIAAALIVVALTAVSFKQRTAREREYTGFRTRLLLQAQSYENGYREPEALALLAAILRRNPDDLEIARQMVELLANRTWLAPPNPIGAIAFSPDGRFLAAMDSDQVLIWDSVRRVPIGEPMESAQIATFAFHPGGRMLATGNYLKNVSFWDLASRSETAQRLAFDYPVDQIAFSCDGALLAVSGSDDSGGMVRVLTWPARQNVGEWTWKAVPGDASAKALSFHPSLPAVAALRSDGRLWLWRAGAQPSVVQAGQTVNAIAFTGDSTLSLFAAAEDGLLEFDPRIPEQTTRLIPNRRFSVLAVSPQVVVTGRGTDRGLVWYWRHTPEHDRPNREPGDIPWRDSVPVEGVAFSPDGLRVATVTAARARIWSTPEEELLPVRGGQWDAPLSTSKRGSLALAGLAEAVAHQALWDPTYAGDLGATSLHVSPGTSDRLKEIAAQTPGSDTVSRFVRWYAADPLERPLESGPDPFWVPLPGASLRENVRRLLEARQDGDVTKAYSLDPSDPQTLLKVAALLAGDPKEKRVASPEQVLEVALRLAPDNPEVISGVADALAGLAASREDGAKLEDRLRLLRSAAGHYERATRLAPADPLLRLRASWVSSALAGALYQSGKRNEGRQADEAALSLSRSAAEALEKQRQLRPGDETLRTNAAAAYGNASWHAALLNRSAEAIDAARKSLALDPSIAWVKGDLANGSLLAGEPERARVLRLRGISPPGMAAIESMLKSAK